jgi:hypothetical protein
MTLNLANNDNVSRLSSRAQLSFKRIRIHNSHQHQGERKSMPSLEKKNKAKKKKHDEKTGK